LPVGCRAGQFPLVRGAKSVWRVEHRLKSQAPQHDFVPDSCAPYVKACVRAHGPTPSRCDVGRGVTASARANPRRRGQR
jgi:hypothetical protein